MKQFAIGLFTWLISLSAYGTTVLMYHDINYDTTDQYSVTPEQFKAQMQYIKDNGYTVIRLSDIDTRVGKNVVITFDDGYHSFKQYAEPVLRSFNYPSTINVVGEWIGTVVPDIKNRKALSYADIKTLHNTGLVDFGSHTGALHKFKGGVLDLTEEQLVKDFTTFNTVFKENTDITIRTIAWPYGRYNSTAVDAAIDSNIQYIQTSNKGKYSGNSLHIERQAVHKGVKFEDLL